MDILASAPQIVRHARHGGGGTKGRLGRCLVWRCGVAGQPQPLLMLLPLSDAILQNLSCAFSEHPLLPFFLERLLNN